MSNLTSIDLFSGCGGLSLGLHAASFELSLAVDHNTNALTALRNHFPDVSTLDMDMGDFLKGIELKDSSLPRKGDVDVVCGGPPCQGFCGINRHRSFDDPRNSLFEIFLRSVELLMPRVVVIENVNGILSLENGKAVTNALQFLEALGYSVSLNIIQAGCYGVPQNRWRVVIIGIKKHKSPIIFLKPIHYFHRTPIFDSTLFKDRIVHPPRDREDLFDKYCPELTVEDAIKDMPLIENGTQYNGKYLNKPASKYSALLRGQSIQLKDHECSKLGPVNLERVINIPKGSGAGWTSLPEDLQPKNLARVGTGSYENRFGRLYWDRTFSTIMTKPEPYWGRVLHPDQDRVISVRECARAQGFPDSFEFHGKVSEKYTLVGNSVAPPMGRAIAWTIRQSLGDKSVEEEIEAYRQSIET